MSFSIQIEPSHQQFQAEAGQTILDAALHNGFALSYGCRNGACGSCKGKILQGEVHYGEHLASTLTNAEKKSGMALFCKAEPLSDLIIEAREIGAAKKVVVKILPCRIQKMNKLTHDIMELSLRLPQKEKLLFLAGQYIDILLPGGKRRSFSIANAPHDDQYLQLHIRHVENGQFTTKIFTQTKEKDMLRFEGPLGSFFLREDSDAPIIMMGGGTGFGPLKGMIEHAIEMEIQRPIHLFRGVRAQRDLYMHDLCEQWAAEHENIHYTPVLSAPDEQDTWQGKTGYVHLAVIDAFDDLSTFDIYTCGPPVMVDAGRKDFVAHGAREDHLYTDSFELANDY